MTEKELRKEFKKETGIGRIPQQDYIKWLEAYVQEKDKEIEQLKELLEKQFDRMDKARYILTEDSSQWKVLDTTLDREKYEQLKSK